MIELKSTQTRALRAQAHHLKPVVSISQNGLTENVIKEIDHSLKAHELIKVKLYGFERVASETMLATICEQLSCAPIQHIGNILVLWREIPASDIKVPAKRRKPKPMNKKQAAEAIERKRRKT